MRLERSREEGAPGVWGTLHLCPEGCREHLECGGLFAGVRVGVNPAMFLEVIVASPLRDSMA